VHTRGVLEKNNPLIMNIFIGLGAGTHKIQFFSKFVYVQLAHMLGQNSYFENFIKMYVKIIKLYTRIFLHLLLRNTIRTIFKGVLFL
jgi:hypothetical protein